MNAKQSSPLADSADGLAELQTQLAELKEQMMRAKADYLNLERQMASERQRLVLLATADLARDVLGHLDHLELALRQAADSDLSKGVTMVRDGLRATLQEHGVELFEPVGQAFDPVSMEAVGQAEGAAGTVVSVQSAGARMSGPRELASLLLLRPAQVVVGVQNPTEKNQQGTEPAEAHAEENSSLPKEEI